MAKEKANTKKKWRKTLLKVLGILVVVALVIGLLVYSFVLQYPELKENPIIGKWYRVSDSSMKDSEGGSYHALFNKGSENKVMIYFAGGGVSINDETARDDTYNTKLVKPDMLANTTMNMGGLASDVEGSPFKNWSMILFPYATGDFHSGTGEFRYTDKDGKEKILYHNGYTNYSAAMKQIMEKAGIENADTVLVTGYSAGGWGAAILADDIYTNYFLNAANKTLFVDSSMALYDDWHDTAVNVWQSPKSITDNIKTDNLTMDMLRHLREKYGDGIHLLYGTSTRDGDLAKVQHYFQNGIMDVDETVADIYQQTLKEAIPQFKELNVSLFIWDGISYYNDPRNMTSHTIIATPVVWVPFEEQNKSVAEWLTDAIDGNLNDYGLDLVNKTY
ncbi:MAG: esterase [Oscillospiraceae bacterium]|nr:esterase [Oscillospiraceae bacterium]